MIDKPPRCPGRRRVWLEDVQYDTRNKIEVVLDEKPTEAELELEYIAKTFYDVGDIFAKVSLAFLGLHFVLILFYPGMRYHASVGAVFWFNIFVIYKYIARYKETEYEMYGKQLFETFFEVTVPVVEIFQISNNSVSSEEARNAHVSMTYLAVYGLMAISFRILFPKYKKSPVICIIYPLLAFKYPRFGIFGPCYEALAWFVAVSLGFAIGGLFDEMRWKYFLLVHEKELEIKKKSKELLKESRKQEMAMGVLSSFEQARWKA